MLPAGVDLFVAGPHDAVTAAATLSSGRLPGVKLPRIADQKRKAG
jgi:hypothetical protein